MADDDPRLHLVSNRPKACDSESLPRRTIDLRYRQRGLEPWRPKLIEATAIELPQPEQVGR